MCPCSTLTKGYVQVMRVKAHKEYNHRIVDVGRDLWRSSGLTTLLKQGYLE